MHSSVRAVRMERWTGGEGKQHLLANRELRHNWDQKTWMSRVQKQA